MSNQSRGEGQIARRVGMVLLIAAPWLVLNQLNLVVQVPLGIRLGLVAVAGLMTGLVIRLHRTPRS